MSSEIRGTRILSTPAGVRISISPPEEFLEKSLQVREIVVGGAAELHDDVQIAGIRLSAPGVRAEQRNSLDAEALQARPIVSQSLKNVCFRQCSLHRTSAQGSEYQKRPRV